MELKLRTFSENYEMFKARKEAHRKVELEEAHKVAIEVCNKFQEYLDTDPEIMSFKWDLFERFLDHDADELAAMNTEHRFSWADVRSEISEILRSLGYKVDLHSDGTIELSTPNN